MIQLIGIFRKTKEYRECSCIFAFQGKRIEIYYDEEKDKYDINGGEILKIIHLHLHLHLLS